MTHAQQLLRAAAANLCRASDSDKATEEALRLMQEARLVVESVEITIGVNQAVREETLREGSR